MSRKIKLNINLLFVIIFILFISCKKNNEVTINLNPKVKNKTLLERIDQHPQLKKALQHYSMPQDSLKRKALLFLIQNIENKNGLTSMADKEIVPIYNKMYKASLSDTFDFKKKYNYPYIFNTTKILDIDSIKSDELIENIDLAFEAYQFPWAKKVPFKDFCEFVLPYRILDEPLSNWRKFFFQKNKKLVEYLLKNKIEDPKKVCEILNDTIIKKYKYYSKLELPCPNLINLYQNPIGVCTPRYLLYAALARSIGIPIAIDFTPQFSNFAGTHYWVTLIQQNNFPFNAGEKWEECPYRGVKYFRYIYTNSARNLSERSPLYNPNVVDITNQYTNRNINNLILEINHLPSKEIYLFSFGMSKEFVCLQKAKINHKKITFDNISYLSYSNDIILMIGYYKGDIIVPIDNPFMINTFTKQITSLSPSKNLVRNIRLFRKFPITLDEQDFYNEVEEATIQGSNFKNFRNKTVILTFKLYPDNTAEVKLNNKFNFNYYRYYPNKSGQINLAELQFFFNEEKIQPSPKKYYQSNPHYKNIEYLSDNNIRTYFSSSNGNWIGIDRSKNESKNLKYVKIIARNTYNLVEKGNTYELLYFDLGWKSLGIKKACDSFIDFKNVPYNSLLLLKNHSEGYQERIFTYGDYNEIFSKQIFR